MPDVSRRVRTCILAALLLSVAAWGTANEARAIAPSGLEDQSLEDITCRRNHVIHLYQQAEDGDPQSQFELAMALAEGSCVEQDPEEALHWLTRAADTRHASASYHLAEIIMHHDTGSEGNARALNYFTMAAEQGHVMAQHRLGVLRLWNASSEEDRHHGLYWLGAAASSGHGFSAASLGMIYGKGMHGVLQDTCMALDWYSAAQELRFHDMADFIAEFIDVHAEACR
ncbi:MAG: tetratricopeptide repeat protein [Pseudomonadota bacterium]